VLSALTGAFAIAASMSHGPIQIGTTLAAIGATGVGVKELGGLFGGGLDLSLRQREMMDKHPMAYMHTLASRRR